MPQTDNFDLDKTVSVEESTRKIRSKGSLKKLTRQTQVEPEKRREMLKQESKDSGIVTEMIARPKEVGSSYQRDIMRSEQGAPALVSKGSKKGLKSKNMSDKIKRSQSVKEKRAKPVSADKERSHDDLEIELLTPKQNGSMDDEEKKNPSMIRGMWRKAFKTLKSSPSVEKLTKKSSFHRKKQNSKEADEEVEQINPGPVDPVYSLLKCAADLPRSGGKSPCLQHAHCSGQHGASYTRFPSGGDSSGNTSKTSSPSSSDLHTTTAVPHSPESLGSDFKNFYKQTSPAKKTVSPFDSVL